MVVNILASIVIFCFTIFFIVPSYFFYFLVNRTFFSEEFKENWTEMDKKRKGASIIMMLFPIIVYGFLLYLMIDMWIFYLNNIV